MMFSLFFKKKHDYFSDYHALKNSNLNEVEKNKLKINLGMYSSVNLKYVKDLVYKIKYYILIQDIEKLECCFNNFEKKYFVSTRYKKIILTLFYPFFQDRVYLYAKNHNIKHILSYFDSAYIDSNNTQDKYFLYMNSTTNFYLKHQWLNSFLKNNNLEKIDFINKKFCIQNMKSDIKYTTSLLKKVSVIMTVYNNVEYIKFSIDSILSQKYFNLELIIVDDGSTDGTTQFLKDYNIIDARIRVIYLKENKGTYKARNIALKYAIGEYIAFQDADDYSHVSRLYESINILEKNNTLVAVSSKYIRMNINGHFTSLKGIPLIRWSPLTLVFRREKVLMKLQGFDEVSFGADSEFYSKLIFHFGLQSHHIINKVMMFCLDREYSLMKSNNLFYGFSKQRNLYRDQYSHQLLL